jgi:hypothetical protein
VSVAVGDGVKVRLGVGAGVSVGASVAVGDGLDVGVWVRVREAIAVDVGKTGSVTAASQPEANSKMAKSHIHFIDFIFLF